MHVWWWFVVKRGSGIYCWWRCDCDADAGGGEEEEEEEEAGVAEKACALEIAWRCLEPVIIKANCVLSRGAHRQDPALTRGGHMMMRVV